jgi:hypothetical protein
MLASVYALVAAARRYSAHSEIGARLLSALAGGARVSLSVCLSGSMFWVNARVPFCFLLLPRRRRGDAD